MGQDVTIPYTFEPQLGVPTRIHVSGYTYKVVAPYFPRVPLLGTVKLLLNWVSTVGVFAKNITYLAGPTNYDTTNTVTLKALAEQVMTVWRGSNMNANYGNQWSLSSVTAKDNGTGSEAQATSTSAPIPGITGSSTYPPSAAVVVSFAINANYRGGKPRWYIPGVPTSAVATPGSPTLSVAYADAVQASGKAIMQGLQGFLVDSVAWNLGTISYQTGHAARPTPLFRLFTSVRVHERLDTQRRRLGKESLYPIVGP